jgi:hypothetical protein
MTDRKKSQHWPLIRHANVGTTELQKLGQRKTKRPTNRTF